MNKELNAAEAVYGFVGWLTTREERTVMSAKDDCAPIAELIKRFCTENNLPEVSDQWPLNLIHPSGEVAVPNCMMTPATVKTMCDEIERLTIIASELQDLCDRQAKRLEEVEKDAARYQWVTADHADHETRLIASTIGQYIALRGKGATDAAIDAAMEAK